VTNKYDMIIAVLSLVSTILAVGIPLVLQSLTGRKRQAAEYLGTLASTTIGALAKEVRDLKDPNKPGVWDEDTQRALKLRAIRAIRQIGMKELEIVTGAAKGSASIDQFLDSLVEAHVEFQKPPVIVGEPIEADPAPAPAPAPAPSDEVLR
jgi:hypothetical protein